MNFAKPHKKLSTLTLVSLGCLACASSQAQTEPSHYERTGQWYVSGGLGFADGRGEATPFQNAIDNNSVTASVSEYDDHRGGWYFGAGYQPLRHFAMEIEYLDLKDVEVDIDATPVNLPSAQAAIAGLLPIHSKGFGIKLVGIVPLESKWRLLVKAGYHQWDEAGSRGDQESPILGLAFDKYLTENINLVFSASRYEIDDAHFPMYSAGIAYYFGDKKHVETMPEPVEMVKPPEPMAVSPAPEPEKPQEPAPMDSDQDGVIDSLDKCASSTPGAVVNKVGCELKKEVRLEVQFESGSSKVAQVDREQFIHLASTLKQDPSLIAVVEGHTDSSGGEALNQKLSKARAQAVAALLMKDFGVMPKALEVVGYGEAQPLVSNDTPKGRSQNRRVMVQLKK